MPILSFNKKFADKVRAGLKTQTIRAFRKYPIRPNDKLFLYTGLRTKYSKKLCNGICIGTSTIRIETDGIRLTNIGSGSWTGPFLQGGWIVDLDKFAQADGFDDWQDMLSWWEGIHGLPFEGTLIHWKTTKQ